MGPIHQKRDKIQPEHESLGTSQPIPPLSPKVPEFLGRICSGGFFCFLLLQFRLQKALLSCNDTCSCVSHEEIVASTTVLRRGVNCSLFLSFTSKPGLSLGPAGSRRVLLGPVGSCWVLLGPGFFLKIIDHLLRGAKTP
jgi:hypothetical protein